MGREGGDHAVLLCPAPEFHKDVGKFFQCLKKSLKLVSVADSLVKLREEWCV